MRAFKHLFLLLFIAGVFALTAACGDNNTTNEKVEEKTGQDGGTTTEKEEPKGPIELTFEPATGAEIEPKDTCITVKMSIKPGKLVKAEFIADGASTPTPASFSYDTKTDKDKKTALVCPYSLLDQGVKYKLNVTVKSQKPDDKEYNGTAEYTTKAPYADKDAPAAGTTINLKIDSILTPELLGSLLEGQKDSIPPILVNVHKRDEGKKGNIIFIGGLGKGPEGGSPHEGKDVVDTETPVSISLVGKFDGRWFSVGPTTFILSIAGVSVVLDNFTLTGIFTEDSTNVEEARLSAVIDPEFVKKQFEMDICAIVDCDENPDGTKSVLVAGKIVGVANPLEYSAFITKPLYLENNIAADTKIEFYTTGDTKKEDVTVEVKSCKGSQKEEKPCSEADGATIADVAGDASVTIDDSKKKGEITLPTLEANTWYQVNLTAKDANGKEFKTFARFKTKE